MYRIIFFFNKNSLCRGEINAQSFAVFFFKYIIFDIENKIFYEKCFNFQFYHLVEKKILTQSYIETQKKY